MPHAPHALRPVQRYSYSGMKPSSRSITLLFVPIHAKSRYGLRCLGVLSAMVLTVAMHGRIAAAGPVKAPNLLRVHVIGLRNDHGNVRCSLFTSTEGFPGDGEMWRLPSSRQLSIEVPRASLREFPRGRTRSCCFMTRTPTVSSIATGSDYRRKATDSPTTLALTCIRRASPMRAFRLREEPWIHALTSTTDGEPPDHEPELNTLETARRCASRSTLSMPTKSARIQFTKFIES